jgi:hypothetical protein
LFTFLFSRKYMIYVPNFTTMYSALILNLLRIMRLISFYTRANPFLKVI